MAVSTAQALKTAKSRLAAQQPGHPLTVPRDVVDRMIRTIETKAPPQGTPAEQALRRWGQAIPKNVSQRMGRDLDSVREELHAEFAARKLALELAGAKLEGEET